MAHGGDHIAEVDAWTGRVAHAPPPLLVERFEEAFGALWRRAHRTLGDVTLTAIVDRVLYTAAERYPTFGSLALDENGLQCRALREVAANDPPADLADGIRFVLVEFLTVLGNLTAEVLSPALHRELATVPADGGPADPGPPRASIGARKPGDRGSSS